MRMEEATMRRRVASARVAMLSSTTPEGHAHVVPVCFAIVDDSIVTVVDRKPKTTTALRRLDNVRAHPTVSLLFDHYEEDWQQLWWVRVDGTARVVDDRGTIGELVPSLVEKYPQYRSHPPVGPAIVIRPRHWVGWDGSGSRA